MLSMLKGDLKDVRIPCQDVKEFMNEIESGLVNSDDPKFYEDLNNTESFEDIFKKYDD